MLLSSYIEQVELPANMNPINNIPIHQRAEFMSTLEELQVKDALR